MVFVPDYPGRSLVQRRGKHALRVYEIDKMNLALMGVFSGLA